MIFPTISLRVERWKFNKDYGVYVSTLGNFKDRHKRRLPIKIRDGYCYIETEIGKWKSAHRLVMLTWKPIPNAEELTVDHLNHNKRENTIYNLEWVSEAENQRRAKIDNLTFIDKGNTYTIVEQLSPKKQTKKLVSIFSHQVSVEEYRSHLMGYEVNGKKCITIGDIFEEVRRHYDKLTDAELLNRIRNIVERFETRHNVGGGVGLRIKKGLVISPIYDKMNIVLQKGIEL